MGISVEIECARGEILNALEKIRQQYQLPTCIIDGILSSILADVRGQEKIELINEMNQMLVGKNEELEKAKQEAKKVLKSEQKEQQQDGKEDADGSTDKTHNEHQN